MPADLASNLAARLRASAPADLQLIDRALGSLEGVRERDTFGRRWTRRIATGPGDVDRDWHLTRQHSAIEPHDWKVTTACKGTWAFDDHVEQTDDPPLEERCTACWREAVQGDPLGLALIAAWGEIQDEARARAENHERERDEMVPRQHVNAALATIGPLMTWDEAVSLLSANDREVDVTIGLPGDDMSDRVVVDEPALDVDPRDIGAGEGT